MGLFTYLEQKMKRTSTFLRRTTFPSPAIVRPLIYLSPDAVEQRKPLKAHEIGMGSSPFITRPSSQNRSGLGLALGRAEC